ncbi:ribonucleotide-diphosphate reductase subunit beta [Alkalicoccus urumqiensis]|uniref:Ribonucleoside-diphosphate reductase subunit beta n=1 Tax=Alkalicoccus urumqiensis TaxID=1548213 RepID=A0A2P6MGR1_ALKUR|nr:ribonucleotide-diphosphate reductase subunit beta [Alkalicoccus urumqiensis]PRO65457.1 ribonucleotide-diphosphate reductase subunit beta [Alkalicoccus urumqiensis]
MPDTALNKMTLMNLEAENKSKRLVNGQASGILNWNDIAYPQMYDMYQALLSNFWKAQEINMQDDIKQWDSLSSVEQDVFLRLNAQLASLDSLQTPTMMQVMNYVTDPGCQAIFAVIAQQEAVHNESYSYVLSSLVSGGEQKKRFDEARRDPVVRRRNEEILAAYESFHQNPSLSSLFTLGIHSIVLEGIYFYAGFAYFYHLARQQKMVKTSTMISYIQRDEMQHAYFVSYFLRMLRRENPELQSAEAEKEAAAVLRRGAELEKEWARDVLQPIDGIDMEEYEKYVEYLANKRMRQLGMDNIFPEQENPMPWIHVFSDDMMNETKSDFFEQKSRAYSKVTERNGFDEL